MFAHNRFAVAIMNAQQRRQEHLLDSVVHYLHGVDGQSMSLRDLIASRKTAFESAVSSIAARLPAPLSDFQQRWLQVCVRKPFILFDDAIHLLDSLKLNFVHESIRPEFARDYLRLQYRFLNLDKMITELTIQEELLRFIDFEQFQDQHHLGSNCCITCALPQDRLERVLFSWAQSGEHAPYGVRFINRDTRISVTVLNRALRLAAASGQASTVREFVRFGAEVDESAQASALRLAAVNGHVEVVAELLASCGDRIANLARVGIEALRFAREKQHRTVAKVLVADERIVLAFRAL